MDYIIVHELCHIKELNHSRNFWALVAEHIPEYKAHIKELRGYEKMGWTRYLQWKLQNDRSGVLLVPEDERCERTVG